MTTSVQQVAIVGTGVIGASWATAFLARGLDVTAAIPRPTQRRFFVKPSQRNGP